MIARVFPRLTQATPDDAWAFIDCEPSPFLQVEKVMVSCAFTWDILKAEYLAEIWSKRFPTELGGTAFGKPEGEFVPGMFLKHGYTITSRGCPNHCWFCNVWKKEPMIKELPIRDGWIIQDDNLLACSETHIRKVFEMLKHQPHGADFSGGIDCSLLKDWHIDLLSQSKFHMISVAYDTPDDYEPLVEAVKKFKQAGFDLKHKFYCYVLIGYPKDTFELAENRLKKVLNMGITPLALTYRDFEGKKNSEWGKFQRLWARPSIIYSRKKKGEI